MSDLLEKISNLDLSYIDKKGAAKVIKFDEEFFKRSADKQVEYLVGLASAMNEAVATAYKERDALAEEKQQAIREKEVAERLMNIHKQNLVKGLEEANANTQRANRELEVAIAERKRFQQALADCSSK